MTATSSPSPPKCRDRPGAPISQKRQAQATAHPLPLYIRTDAELPERTNPTRNSHVLHLPEDAHWNAERQAVELEVEIGEYHGVVQVQAYFSAYHQAAAPSPPVDEERELRDPSDVTCAKYRFRTFPPSLDVASPGGERILRVVLSYLTLFPLEEKRREIGEPRGGERREQS
jgi:hypothetical protein